MEVEVNVIFDFWHLHKVFLTICYIKEFLNDLVGGKGRKSDFSCNWDIVTEVASVLQ